MSISKQYSGSCHCGAITIGLSSKTEPSDFQVRECQCSFCRKHGTRAIADPRGLLIIRINDPECVNRYSFGLKTADYHVCSRCGVYVAATTRGDDDPVGIAIVNALDNREEFSAAPIPAVYDSETIAERITRRRAKWTPVRFEI